MMTRGEAIRHLGENAIVAGIQAGISAEEAAVDFRIAMLSLGVTEEELGNVATRAIIDWQENDS